MEVFLSRRWREGADQLSTRAPRSSIGNAESSSEHEPCITRLWPSWHQAKWPIGTVSYFCQDSCPVKTWTPHFTDGESKGSERPSNLPETTQLTGRAGTQSQVRQTPGFHCSKCGLWRNSTDIPLPKLVRNAQPRDSTSMLTRPPGAPQHKGDAGAAAGAQNLLPSPSSGVPFDWIV